MPRGDAVLKLGKLYYTETHPDDGRLHIHARLWNKGIAILGNSKRLAFTDVNTTDFQGAFSLSKMSELSPLMVEIESGLDHFRAKILPIKPAEILYLGNDVSHDQEPCNLLFKYMENIETFTQHIGE